MLHFWLSIVIGSWVGTVTIISAVAIIRAWRHFRIAPYASPQTQTPHHHLICSRPRVVVVRPCAGDEPYLRQSLASTQNLRYRGPLRVVFSTSTADDTARPILIEVAAALRSQGITTDVQVIDPRGPNLKSSQLAGLLDTADDDIALVIDSDVELPRLALESWMAPLGGAENRVGALWCPPVERNPCRWGDRLSAALLGGSLHAFMLLGILDPRGLVGKTIALRLDALRSIGGFAELVEFLGEDMELARRLRLEGWTTTMSSTIVRSLASGRRPSQVLARYTRWLMVIRAQRPLLLASYPLLLAATPGLLLATIAATVGGIRFASLALVIVIITRLAVGLTARHLAGRSLHPIATAIDAVLADILLLTAFVRALLGPARVTWRDRTLSIDPQGRLRPTPSTASS